MEVIEVYKARAGGERGRRALLSLDSIDYPALQDADIAQCAPVQQLSVLKHELEEAQSPVMRQVFAWLFPFGPGWNSGAGSPIPARTCSDALLTRPRPRPSPRNVLHQLVRIPA